MNETTMTIVGNVVEDPRRRQTKNGHAVTNFRVASTSRRYDREQERFVDNGTLFITVTCWRGLASNVDQSIRKGQPVVVTTNVKAQWQNECCEARRDLLPHIPGP